MRNKIKLLNYKIEIFGISYALLMFPLIAIIGVMNGGYVHPAIFGYIFLSALVVLFSTTIISLDKWKRSEHNES